MSKLETEINAFQSLQKGNSLVTVCMKKSPLFIVWFTLDYGKLVSNHQQLESQQKENEIVQKV